MAPPDAASTDDESERAFELIGDRFINAMRAMLRSSKRQLMERNLYMVGDHQLTPVQVLGLEGLVRRDQWRMRDIAAELHVDPSTSSRTLTPLVDLGLAERATDPDDRRQVLIHATDEGQAVCARITDRRRQLMRSVLSSMSPERRILFTELFEEYLRAVDAAPAPAPQQDPGAG